jgi:signal transduction histidine kinase
MWRELDEEGGQSVLVLLIELGNLSAALADGPPGELRGHVDVIKKLAENSVNVVRNMALLLRPSMLDDLGLVPALQWQAREVSKRTGMRVDVAAENVSDHLPEEHDPYLSSSSEAAQLLETRWRSFGPGSVREEDTRPPLAIRTTVKASNRKWSAAWDCSE